VLNWYAQQQAFSPEEARMSEQLTVLNTTKPPAECDLRKIGLNIVGYAKQMKAKKLFWLLKKPIKDLDDDEEIFVLMDAEGDPMFWSTDLVGVEDRASLQNLMLVRLH
jgi:hypothetical protein